jgi:putative SOS response-associated peptidase YedK
MRWGLIPHWAKDEKTAHKMINAPVETLTQRPAFWALLSHNRERSTDMTLDAYPVSRMVNKPSIDSHALIQRVE